MAWSEADAADAGADAGSPKPCWEENGGCDLLTSCTSEAGQTICGPCPEGHSGTGEAGCVDVDECVLSTPACDPLTSCTNVVGSWTCSDCPAGWGGTGKTGCIDREWNQWPVQPEGPTNYTVGDETVRDNVTGLEWQRHVSASSYRWEEAKSYCSTLQLAGRAGWRLPTEIELLSVVDATRNAPAINPDAFPETPSQPFWSASPATRLQGYVWLVDFERGDSTNQIESAPYGVRCVRSDETALPPQQHYEVDAETVRDLRSGLVWQRDGSKRATRAAANLYCKNLNLAGYSSAWRLPTKTELETLVDRRGVPPGPCIDTAAFLSTAKDFYWSVTAYAGDSMYAGVVDFESGASLYHYRTYSLYVRCVR